MNPDGHTSSTCDVLKDVVILCQRMKCQGRPVPFNSLKIEARNKTQDCPRDSGCDSLVHTILPPEFDPKYLEIIEYNNDPIQDSSVSLLHAHASQIQYLTTQSLPLMKEMLDGGNQSVSFPKLEEITILTIDLDCEVVEQKNILRTILGKSPNLKKVFLDGIIFLEIVPEEYHRLAGEFAINLDKYHNERSRFQKFAEVKPQLRRLGIFGNYNDESDVDPGLKTFLSQLLQSCARSLEKLSIYGGSFPTFIHSC